MSSPITQRVKEPADPSQASSAATSPDALDGNFKLINWSAFLFALLQSVCSAIIALNGVRLLIGVGAFAAASGALKLADRMHIAAIRIPMMVLALAGSVLNLVVLWQLWRLRKPPAPPWGQQTLSQTKNASEWVTIPSSILTPLSLSP